MSKFKNYLKIRKEKPLQKTIVKNYYKSIEIRAKNEMK